MLFDPKQITISVTETHPCVSNDLASEYWSDYAVFNYTYLSFAEIVEYFGDQHPIVDFAQRYFMCNTRPLRLMTKSTFENKWKGLGMNNWQINQHKI